MSAFSGSSWTRDSETITHVLPCPAAQQAAQWHTHGVMWRGALPAAPFCGAPPPCAGVCCRCGCVARQQLHFGFFPRKLAGQANCALQQTHTRCGIVPHGVVGRCGLRQPVLRAACPHCGPILMTAYQCRIQCGNMELFCEMELLD